MKFQLFKIVFYIRSERRKLIEKRLELRDANYAEFKAIREESMSKAQANFQMQCEEARKRNADFKNEVSHAVSIASMRASKERFPTSASIKLKNNFRTYTSQVEQLLPAWRQYQTAQQMEILKNLNYEKEITSRRRERAKHEIERNLIIQETIEKERRELVLSRALEQHEKLSSLAQVALLKEQGKDMDRAIRFQLENASNEILTYVGQQNMSDNDEVGETQRYPYPITGTKLSNRIPVAMEPTIRNGSRIQEIQSSSHPKANTNDTSNISSAQPSIQISYQTDVMPSTDAHQMKQGQPLTYVNNSNSINELRRGQSAMQMNNESQQTKFTASSTTSSLEYSAQLDDQSLLDMELSMNANKNNAVTPFNRQQQQLQQQQQQHHQQQQLHLQQQEQLQQQQLHLQQQEQLQQQQLKSRKEEQAFQKSKSNVPPAIIISDASALPALPPTPPLPSDQPTVPRKKLEDSTNSISRTIERLASDQSYNSSDDEFNTLPTVDRRKSDAAKGSTGKDPRKDPTVITIDKMPTVDNDNIEGMDGLPSLKRAVTPMHPSLSTNPPPPPPPVSEHSKESEKAATVTTKNNNTSERSTDSNKANEEMKSNPNQKSTSSSSSSLPLTEPLFSNFSLIQCCTLLNHLFQHVEGLVSNNSIRSAYTDSLRKPPERMTLQRVGKAVLEGLEKELQLYGDDVLVGTILEIVRERGKDILPRYCMIL